MIAKRLVSFNTISALHHVIEILDVRTIDHGEDEALMWH